MRADSGRMRVKRAVASALLAVATVVATPPERSPSQTPRQRRRRRRHPRRRYQRCRRRRSSGAPTFDLRRRIQEDIARTEGQKAVAYGGFGVAIAVAIATGVVAYGRAGDERLETAMNGTLIVAPLMLLSSYLLFDRHEKIGRLRLEPTRRAHDGGGARRCRRLAATTAAGGCATIFQGTSQTVAVTSQPSGARVRASVDGNVTMETQTPTTLTLDKGQDVVLRVEYPGRAPADVLVERSLSGGYAASLMLLSPIAIVVDLATGAAWKYDDPIAVTLPPVSAVSTPARAPGRDLQLMLALMAGTGYGWASGNGEVNADTPSPGGGGWAALGHVAPEIGIVSRRARLFVAVGYRHQIIRGTTDVYADNRVFHTPDSARAVFLRAGWILASPDARWQPYLALTSGFGWIRHLATLPQYQNCGPAANEECVDTVASEPVFVGGGGGVRIRVTDNLYGVLGLETQVSPGRDVNIDGNAGLAVVF